MRRSPTSSPSSTACAANSRSRPCRGCRPRPTAPRSPATNQLHVPFTAPGNGRFFLPDECGSVFTRCTTCGAGDAEPARIVEAERGKTAAPHAAGVEAIYVVACAGAERRPVAENDAGSRTAALRQIEPRQLPWGLTAGCAFVVQRKPAVVVAITQARKAIGNEAQPRPAAQVGAPLQRLIAVHVREKFAGAVTAQHLLHFRGTGARGGDVLRATASRCRSWLPSTVTALSPSDRTYRSTSSDFGPRFTRSPVNHNRSRAGAKSMARNSAISSSKQPCTSPMA